MEKMVPICSKKVQNLFLGVGTKLVRRWYEVGPESFSDSNLSLLCAKAPKSGLELLPRMCVLKVFNENEI